jgi:ubiquinone/menaquinone biosynthesis C-methylase UbiE
VEWASSRAADFGREGHAEFFVADICATELRDDSCQGAMSIDMLWNVPDQAAALREVARVLVPGARFALTSWEGTGPDEIGYHRALFKEAGFGVDECFEKPDWERRQCAVYQRILAEQAALAEEMGEAAFRPMLNEAKRCADGMPNFRHLMVIGRKA